MAAVALAGIKFLVDLRADVRQLLRERPSGAAPLRALNDALRCHFVIPQLCLCYQLSDITYDGANFFPKTSTYYFVTHLQGYRGKSQPHPRGQDIGSKAFTSLWLKIYVVETDDECSATLISTQITASESAHILLQIYHSHNRQYPKS